MATYRIELSDAESQRIEDLARKTGLTPEELLRRGVEEWLTRPGRAVTLPKQPHMWSKRTPICTGVYREADAVFDTR